MTLGPIMTDVQGLSLSDEDRELLRHPLIGGVILFSRNYSDKEQLSALTASIRELRTPSLLIAVDQEGGRVQRLIDGFTRLPPLRWFGKQYEQEPLEAGRLAHIGAWIMAAELLAAGIDFSFAPDVDLDWGLSEIIGDRAFHPSPEVVSSLALSYMQGMREAGMAAVAKHFPGHGCVVADSHLALPEDRRSYGEILDDIAPFRSLIEHGLPGIMSAHIRYTEVDSEIASMSKFWLGTELRANLGFTGAVFSDDLSMAGANVAGDVPDRVNTALQAGSDMVLICNDRAAAIATLERIGEYHEPASQVRLVAMRPDHTRRAEQAIGSRSWQTAVDRLQAAIECPPPKPPPLELDG